MSFGAGFSNSTHIPSGRSPGRSPEKIRSNSRQRSNGQIDPAIYAQNLTPNSVYQQHGRSPNSSGPKLTPTSMFNTTTSDYFGKQNIKLAEPVTAMSIAYATTAANQKNRRVEDGPQVRSNPPHPVSPNHVAVQEQAQRATSQSRQVDESAPSVQSPEQRKGRGHRSPTQKTMLSRALAKANTAVLLDNAQNIEGAIEAYAEACDLLQEVMMRSSDSEDRKKLSAIRTTYSSRIAELHDLDDSFAALMDKALPDDPPADDINASFFGSPSEPTAAQVLEQVHIPPRGESLLPQIYGGEQYLENSTDFSQRPPRRPTNLNIPMEARHMPPPLSPRRPLASPEAERTNPSDHLHVPDYTATRQHARRPSGESLSWLDTVDDAASSHSSSRLSSMRLDKIPTTNLLDETEAEFDAALNAAVDAAYDDEEDLEDTPRLTQNQSRAVIPPRSQPVLSRLDTQHNNLTTDDYLDDDTTEEEERLLDEMTQDFVFDDFHFDGKSKSALPRQSDGSSFTNRTVSSSVPSTTLTNGTTLSTLAENHEIPRPPPTKSLPPPPPPQTQAPAIPAQSRQLQPLSPPSSPPKVDNYSSGINLRDRRLSGHSARLKIETFAPARGTFQPSLKHNGMMEKQDATHANEQRAPHTAPLPAITGPPSTSTQATVPITPITSLHSGDSPSSDSPATPALTQGGSQGSLEETTGAPSSPLRTKKAMPPPPAPMRKILSSSSLRMRNLSLNTTAEESPITPNTSMFPDIKKGVPPVPHAAHPSLTQQTSMSGGMYLFDDHIGAPTSPKTPRTPNAVISSTAPVPLEHCPESFLLRPWWLMRCLYQTLAHPRGGYLSTKLFIPRDIWRVRNVKLRLIEEKVAQCDILTAALLQIAEVNHFDADAVWQELQSFETVLEQVRVVLQKKLGNEVGLSSSANVFKSPTDDPEPLSAKPSNASAAKSFASSWRKLRSKSSSTIATTSSTTSTSKDTAQHTKAGLTISSLPMTSSTNVPSSRSHNARHKIPPPTPSQLPNIPIHHSSYMASLARLFDAVQILDNIARQVVDPGLKCSSETLVGLELSVRNAAEFFAFFVIRFVMADMGLLIDKFLKRGTEWVLS